MNGRSATRGEMIFHHPFPLMSGPKSGSQVRPKRMLESFRRLGYEVVEVTGYVPERVPMMRSIARDVKAGRRFQFCYSESVTSPTALSEPHHLPLHPMADPAFFKSLKDGGIRTGLYYRDIHWRFNQYNETVPLAKRIVAKAFYGLDLIWYSKLVDIVYLPDLGMSASIPCAGRFRFEPLPPGAALRSGQRSRTDRDGLLRLIYIGSITPPHNDVSPLLHAVASTPNAALTISCPEMETKVLSEYPTELFDGVTIVHLGSEQLDELYSGADVACLIYSAHPYRDFAMPVKLFESIGHLTPSIANADTAAGRFIARNGIGWTFDDESGLRLTLKRLADDPTLVEAKRAVLRDVAPSHTWEARAETVAHDLETLGDTGR